MGSFFKKVPLKSENTHAIDIDPREVKTYDHMKICMQMFTTTLFIIANNSNQSKHPTTGEWIKQAVIYPYKGILLCNERE